jgi:hypothetical protein
MRWDPATYDDDRELTDYIWHNYRHLLTAFEWKVWKADVAEWKAERASEKLASSIRKRWGSQDDPEVAAALARGIDLFRRDARDRILAEHPQEVTTNRCARCQRIVATPLARQCLWCGHDWHNAKAL